MVDATHLFSRDGASRKAEAPAAPARAVSPPGVSDYARAVAGLPVAPAQSPGWVEAWSAVSGEDCFVARISGEDGASLVLPLEVVKQGPFRVARFMGGSHAAANFPAASGVGPFSAAAIARAVAAARPGVDLVRLERLLPRHLGHANPLAGLPRTDSPNISLAAGLEGGFEALLDRVSGKRKRKKHRAQGRKFEAAGGWRRFEASSGQEVDEVLAQFFAMKTARFRRMGVADVFGDPAIRSFFRTLFTRALDQSPRPFVLHALEVGGTLRAITGSSHAGDRLVCEFGAITEDELAFASPGEFLSYLNIRDACEQGYSIYDLSVGDEPYKRLWCNIETQSFDVMLPVTAKGRALAAGLHGATALKRRIKQNRVLWDLAKRLRRQKAAQPAEPDED